MSRQDAVKAASVRLIDRIMRYAKIFRGQHDEWFPVLLQLPDDYFKFDGVGEAPDDETPFQKGVGGCVSFSKLLCDFHRDVYPVQRDVVTTEPEPTMWLHLNPPLMYIPDEHAKVDTVHSWTKQFTYTDREGKTCECTANFSTTVTSMIVSQPGERNPDSDVSDVDPDSDVESDSD